MPGLTLALVITAQWVIQSSKNPCFGIEVEIGRAAQEVFLDPSEETRSAATKRLVTALFTGRDVATVLRGCELLDREAIEELWTFSDDSALPPEFRRVSSQGHPRQLSGSYLESLTMKAKDACTKSSLQDCTAEQLTLLVLTENDSVPTLLAAGGLEAFARAHPMILQDPSALALWTKLRREHPDRDDFLERAWRSPNEQIRVWALGDATAEMDPRKWQPNDIAVFVLEARLADGEAALVENNPLLGLTVADADPPEPRQREMAIRYQLGRMGYERAFDLIYPNGVGRSRELSASHLPALNQHFAYEGQVYIADWLARTGNKDAAKLSRAERDRMIDYCNGRWYETDSQAPHPDLEAVWRAIDALQSKQPTPTKQPQQ